MYEHLRRNRIVHLALTGLLTFFALPGFAQSPMHLQVDALVQPDTGNADVQQAQHVRAKRTGAPAHRIDLGTWNPQFSESSGGRGAIQIGASRSIPQAQNSESFAQLLNWQATSNGGWLGAISLRSPQAYAVRLGLLVNALPPSAILRLYSPNQPQDVLEISGQRVLDLLQSNAAAGETSEAARTWWTPETHDDATTLEIELPAGVHHSAVQVAMPELVHIYTNLLLPVEGEVQTAQAIGDSESCNLDASCYSAYASQSDAVARMSYVSNGGGYLCSGTLLNDKQSSYTPYFLTANHCISTQAEASSLTTSWFYQSTGCNTQSLSSRNKVLRNGAQLLYTTAIPDITLLRLLDTPPAGAVFAGWDANAVSIGQSTVGLHHPAGDLKKISFGQVRSYYNCTPIQANGTFSCQTGTQTNSDYYNVLWSSGSTEGGSSGSGLFKDGRLIGVLSGGSGSCTTGSKASTYSRFSNAFLSGMNQWLAAASPDPLAGVARQAVYRFYNTGAGTHFYTNTESERDSIIRNLPTYRYEGIGFYAAAQSGAALSPISRFFNTTSDSHFYTIDDNERRNVQSNLPQFRYEGTTWYASPQAQQGMQAMYRFYNASTSTHFYTANDNERDSVIVNLPNFRYEGIAYYVWSQP